MAFRRDWYFTPEAKEFSTLARGQEVEQNVLAIQKLEVGDCLEWALSGRHGLVEVVTILSRGDQLDRGVFRKLT